MHKFNPQILREYDIRGTVGKTLHKEDAYSIGLRFSLWMRQRSLRTIAICRDGRLSSPELLDTLKRGLIDGGLDITDVDIGPTPMLYYAIKYFSLDAGIMVTGSHNPKEDNGFKFALQTRPFFGADIQEMAQLPEEKAPQQGVQRTYDITDDYITRLLKDLESPAKRLRIAFDPGNGASGDIIRRLTQKINADCFVINDDIDGTFPAHHPDPTELKNMQQLIEVVKKNQCDLGIGFDGDADRIGVVDAKGRLLWGDQLLIILAKDFLAQNPGEKVMTDVKASQAFFDEIRRFGGEPMMWKTGHSHIKQRMNELNVKLAGEMSGHLFFADTYYGYDDGIYAAIRLINYLAKSTETLADLYDALPNFVSTPEIRLDCDDDKKFGIMAQLAEKLIQARVDYDPTDGVRVTQPDGWWLVRASNTQPKLIARCESTTDAGLETLKKHLHHFLDPLL